MSNPEFLESLNEAVKFFKDNCKSSKIKVISHLDADGICSAAILIDLLNKKGLNYSLSIAPQLDDTFLTEISKEMADINQISFLCTLY